MELELQGRVIGPEIIVCCPKFKRSVVVMILRFRECVRNRNLETLRADLCQTRKEKSAREDEDVRSGLKLGFEFP